jgi:F0F1-type ATP synthase delta subunit
MYNKIVEFKEFQRVKEDFKHQQHWESEYRSHTKEMLLNQLLDQQEKNYPLMQECPKGNKQFKALLKVLEEKSSTAWLKQIIQELHSTATDAYRKITQ